MNTIAKPNRSDLPNLVIIMADQMKATASHLYGNPFCETPSLARLAASGVRFDHAVTPHPLCVPARISLWTGQYSHHHGRQRNQTLMQASQTHAFQLWKRAGYHCALIGKNHAFEDPADLGLFDTWCEMDHYGVPADAHHAGLPWVSPVEAINAAHATRRNMPPVPPPLAYATSLHPLRDYGTSALTLQTLRFIEERAAQSQPFALWLSYPDPHSPIETHQAYANLMPPNRIVMPLRRSNELEDVPERTRLLYGMKGVDEAPTAALREQIRVYHAMTRFIDDGVGMVLDALRRNRIEKRTIVVFCADHGDFTGEHGIVDKGGALYDCLVRIPLIVAWPGCLPAGRTAEGMANLVDVVPTLLMLQGLPVPPSMDGNGLPVVTRHPGQTMTFAEYGAGGPQVTADQLASMEHPFRQSLQLREAEGRRAMIRSRDWKYVHDPMGDRDELYDLRADPWELRNLADLSVHRPNRDQLHDRLLAWLDT